MIRFQTMLMGSPPRVREKPPNEKEYKVKTRITPACAGKTLHKPPHLHRPQDHPRVCGKNFGDTLSYFNELGSPPRVREKRIFNLFQAVTLGITPACAGKTLLGLTYPLLSEDHPRVCGKNFGIKLSSSILTGSPPRVREKR